jgi:single-stranded-DNA-specific exonuclease
MNWLEPEVIPAAAALQNVLGGHPLVAQALARRGIRTPDAARAFIDPNLYAPAPPADLPDLEAAAQRLRRAATRGEPVLIWGDFDADGQTSTALLLEALTALGADVGFHVPARDEGHGLRLDRLEEIVARGARIILTCDTGITAHKVIARANTLGVDVIVTDHHTLDEQLPPALAAINPHRLPPLHPFHPLAGVGVAYQLARALHPAAAEQALDLVALGTVADVAALVAENRYLVQRGLKGLRHTPRLGLQAVLEAADVRPEGLTEEHIGFVLGPRLNALGRLADATAGVELLTTADPLQARTLAAQVEGLNARRQWLTKQVADAALAQIERDPSLLSNFRALVLSHPTWPSGIVGIVAGRLAERFGKPTILISTAPGQAARGSGRSVPGVDLIAALSLCAARDAESPGPSLLQTFGGHPGAAGFSLDPERIAELRHALSRAVEAASQELVEPQLSVDGYVTLPELTLDFVAELGRLAPFGRQNPPLTLVVRDLRVVSETTIGRTEEHRRVTVEDNQEDTGTVFWWHGAGLPLPKGRFDLALTARASNFRGIPGIQLEWLDARLLVPEAEEIEPEPARSVLDFRGAAGSLSSLQKLAAGPDVQVWAEGRVPAAIEVRRRQTLAPGSRLVVWTLPPGPKELAEALARVQPDEIALFDHDAAEYDSHALVHRIAGMVKYAVRARQGWFDIGTAAASLAHRSGTVRAALEYLEARGTVSILQRRDAEWQLAAGRDQSDPLRAEEKLSHLKTLLEETSAYRAYARSSPNPIPASRPASSLDWSDPA